MTSSPLTGKTVLLTRRVEQSQEMIDLLSRFGIRTLCFPMIETVPSEDWSGLDSALDHIDKYDWVIFTSANAVRFVVEHIRECNSSRQDVLANSSIFAIGPATASALQQAGISPSLIAEDSKAEGALAALLNSLGGESSIAGLKILLPRAAVARDLLPKELTKLGADVETVEVYRTIRPEIDAEEIRSLLQRGDVDVVAFTSSSTVENFASLFSESFSDLLNDVAVACIGPITASTAHELGLTVAIQPETYSAAALVDAIVAYFSR